MVARMVVAVFGDRAGSVVGVVVSSCRTREWLLCVVPHICARRKRGGVESGAVRPGVGGHPSKLVDKLRTCG